MTTPAGPASSSSTRATATSADNDVENNGNGILLGVSSHCNVTENTGLANDVGLYILYSSDYANVTGNTFSDNGQYGIQFLRLGQL